MANKTINSIVTLDNNSDAIKKLKFHLNGRNLKIIPALVGLTGIGKTAIVNRVAKDLDAEVVYINMAQQNEGDNAIPVPGFDKENDRTQLTFVLLDKLQYILDNKDKKFIIFCDEFVRAQVQVISEWMTILNERQYHGHKFGDNVRFVVAMNPTDTMKGYENTEYVSTELDDAHAARFTFIYMDVDANDWMKWAKSANIHPSVISYIKKYPQHLHGQATGDIRMRSPRAWEYLSDQLYDLEDSKFVEDKMFASAIMSDQIGHDAGPAFAEHYFDFMENVEISDILTGKPIAKSVLKRFKGFELNRQAININNLADQIINLHNSKQHTFTEQDVANFIDLWDTVKSVDTKQNIAVKIDNGVFEIDPETRDIPVGSTAYLFDHNQKYIDFAEKVVNELKQ